MSINKFSRGLIFSASVVALSLNPAMAQIDEVIVTAEKRAENIQDVSAAITALSSDALGAAGIQDITRLENVVPGLRIGSSGGEVRPAMRGARTNEVGVAGTGIAEQVIGIFLDGICSDNDCWHGHLYGRRSNRGSAWPARHIIWP